MGCWRLKINTPEIAGEVLEDAGGEKMVGDQVSGTAAVH